MSESTSKLAKIVLVIAGFALLIWISSMLSQRFHILDNAEPLAETPGTENQATSTATSTTKTHSNGTITFDMQGNFGLALDKDQILVQSYIPPCDENFDYCVYYNGEEFKGTNFESAGIRIKKRADLAQANLCLTSQPLGYTDLKPSVVTTGSSTYSISKFGPLGDAGMGHYAAGELYRLAYNGTCHEFETRIGASQYANYPEGSIKEFGDADQVRVKKMLNDFLNWIKLKDGTLVTFVR